MTRKNQTRSMPAALLYRLRLTERQKNGSLTSRTKLTTIRQKSSLLVVRQPALAVQSVTHCQDVLMFTRLCV